MTTGIFLFSEDKAKLIQKFLESEFKGRCNIILNATTPDKRSGIIIFDEEDIKTMQLILDEIDRESCPVINIGNIKIDNVINLELPFKIKTLTEHIENILNYRKKFVIYFGREGLLDINRKMFCWQQHKIELTEREAEIIAYLYKNGESSKDMIVKNIWNTNALDTNVLEVIVCSIRQKLKEIFGDNFIICNDANYSINSIYL